MVVGALPARGSQPSHFTLPPGVRLRPAPKQSAGQQVPLLGAQCHDQPSDRVECQPLVPSDRGGTNPVPVAIGPPDCGSR